MEANIILGLLAIFALTLAIGKNISKKTSNKKSC